MHHFLSLRREIFVFVIFIWEEEKCNLGRDFFVCVPEEKKGGEEKREKKEKKKNDRKGHKFELCVSNDLYRSPGKRSVFGHKLFYVLFERKM
jgi:hypothetical protein